MPTKVSDLQTAWKRIIGPEEMRNYASLTTPTVVHYPKGKDPDILTQIISDQAKTLEVRRIFYNLCLRNVQELYIPGEDEEDYGDEKYVENKIGIPGRYIDDSLKSANHLFILYDGPGPNIIAFALVNSGTSSSSAYLSLICSTQQQTGRGNARLLLEGVADVLRKLGTTEIKLTATEESLVKKVYEPAGYTVTGTKFYPPRGDSRGGLDFYMSKPLQRSYAEVVTMQPSAKPKPKSWATVAKTGSARRSRNRKTRRRRRNTPL